MSSFLFLLARSKIKIQFLFRRRISWYGGLGTCPTSLPIYMWISPLWIPSISDSNPRKHRRLRTNESAFAFSVKHKYFCSCLWESFFSLNFPCGEKLCWFRQTSYLSQTSQAMLADKIHTNRTNCTFWWTNCTFLWKLHIFVTKYTNFHEHYTHFSGKCTHFGKCTFCCDFLVFYVKNTKIFGLLRKNKTNMRYAFCSCLWHRRSYCGRIKVAFYSPQAPPPPSSPPHQRFWIVNPYNSLITSSWDASSVITWSLEGFQKTSLNLSFCCQL